MNQNVATQSLPPKAPASGVVTALAQEVASLSAEVRSRVLAKTERYRNDYPEKGQGSSIAIGAIETSLPPYFQELKVQLLEIRNNLRDIDDANDRSEL